MKKALAYIGNVIFSLLLVFSIMGTCVSIAAANKGMNVEYCLSLMDSENLVEKAQNTLKAHFAEQENTTGVPATMFENAIAAEKLDEMMEATIRNGFDYLNGNVETLGIKPSFAGLDADMRLFYSSYADMYGYAKDEAYENAVDEAIAASEQSILGAVDVFRFSMLDDAGVMKKVRPYSPWVPRAWKGCLILDGVLLLILLLLNVKKLRQIWYWAGCSLLSAGVILLVPTVWLKSTEWFDRFTVKSEQTFAAVTAYLYGLTDTVKLYAIICLVLAVLAWIVCGICAYRAEKKKKAAKKNRKPSGENR